ncbi:MAG: PAS domain S-box protein, partial [Desulfobulbaceae bacterium]|nr:PAS domain S-box protein [Desulfobulbaceae bacterium]
MAAARDNKVKVFSVDRPPALYFLNQMAIADRFHETAPLYSGKFHRAVKKGNTQLLAQIEQGFSKISETEYQHIERQWLGTPIIPHSWIRPALSFIAIATGLVLILMTWIWFLRRGIEKRTADLQRTSEYLQAVLDSVNDAIFVHDGATGAIIDVNQAMLDMYRITREQALLADANDLSLGSHPYSQAEAVTWMTKARMGKPQTFEWMAKRYQGEVFPVEVSIRFCHIGAATRFLVTVREITERKKTEESLITSEAKYRQLYESMADAFACIDMNGHIFESNKTFQAMVGYTVEELSTMTYANLTPKKWHALESSILKDQVVPLGYSEVYEKEYQHKDGTIIPVELRTFLIRDNLGTPKSMWAIVRDLSERKQAEQQRLETERKMLHTQKLETLGVMAGGIAHDFNNLLMAIQGNLDLAKMDIPLDSPSLAFLDNCMKAIRRAADLTRQMLAYSGKGHFLIQT